MTTYAALLGLLISAGQVAPGEWTVAWRTPAGELVTADVCDEQTTEAANYDSCVDRARIFNAEDDACGQTAGPTYFVAWRAR